MFLKSRALYRSKNGLDNEIKNQWKYKTIIKKLFLVTESIYALIILE